MQPTGRATAYVTAGQWTSKGVPNAAVEDKRLAQEGFRNVISVQTGQGVSWAMELGSASAAAREKAAGAKRRSPTGRAHQRRRRASPSPVSPAPRVGSSRMPTPTSCSPRAGVRCSSETT